MKNTLEGTNNRLANREEQISDLEDRLWEINQSGQQKEKKNKKHEDGLRDLMENINRANICITDPDRRRKSERKKSYLEK